MTDRDTLVGHCKKDAVDVYIGRKRTDGELQHLNNTDVGDPGWLGNPHPVSECDSAVDSVERFADDIHQRVNEDPEFRAALRDLEGVTLGCWCRTTAERRPICHGDLIRAWIRTLSK